MSAPHQGEIERVSADAESRPSAEDLPAQIESLPPDMQTMVSVMAGVFRSSSGPDPETAKVMAESEMHEETCKLQAYTQSLKNRDSQSERDQVFRMRKLTQDFTKTILIGIVAVFGIICGLYLTTIKKEASIGNPILVASFMAVLGVRPNLDKSKE